uniref:Protein-export membrane protein SecF n=1 Tax=candidate division WOR-3 bacterium TaxID=2052148 RepID=A0A7C4GFK7_UNCW3
MRLIPETNIDFVGKRRVFFAVSSLLVLASIAALVFIGIRWGVDFTGGSRFQVHFEKPVKLEAMRAALTGAGIAGATIQQDQSGDFILRVGATGGESENEAVRQRVEELLRSAFVDNPPDISVDAVGPQVSRELRGRVLLAVGLGLLAILIYVSFRFDLRFGTGAVLSLIHDALIAVGFVVLFQHEVTITIVAALLTVIGYSVNDSIVVSDRIREDLRKMRKEPFDVVVNRAINQTLGRTAITSLTLLLVSLALLFLGAASIRDFALIMTVGTVVGTYSSVGVVANFVVEWERRFPSRHRR